MIVFSRYSVNIYLKIQWKNGFYVSTYKTYQIIKNILQYASIFHTIVIIKLFSATSYTCLQKPKIELYSRTTYVSDFGFDGDLYF